jgi:hypothetical protein
MLKPQAVCIVVACVLFVVSGFSYRADPAWGWHHRALNAGLFFFALSFYPWTH